ncbi:MAG: ParA family protein [Chloroflexi bacterium]|nr:ParA family protein [Chloroflexota bacterium]
MGAWVKGGYPQRGWVRKMQVITVANLKGGVGKTATTHALGVVLAQHLGRRVLLVDVDPQASLSSACGIEHADESSLAEVLGGETWGQLPLSDVIRQIEPNLAVAPASPRLAAIEQSLKTRIRREMVLKDALTTVSGDRSRARRGEIGDAQYDIVLIDTPPSFGLLTVNALVAADGVLVPCRPEIMSLRSLRIFMRRLEDVLPFHPRLKILGVLPTFFDRRFTHHQSMLHMMRTAGYPILPVTIGRSVRVAEAAEVGQSVVSYAPDNERTLEYMVLGSIVDAWLQDQARSPQAQASFSTARWAKVERGTP